jgi:KUP system potassium uptake protein
MNSNALDHDDNLKLEQQGHEQHHQSNDMMTMIAALGVVFGDIGTSPLYALRECFTHGTNYTINPLNVFGILSLFFWSLLIIISLKYVLFIMHADNKGEGGILALESLARRSADKYNISGIMPYITIFGIFGSALLYGDGVITPAISVLSALEGLRVATTFFDNMIQPLTTLVLISLFCVQRFGTAAIGAIFGPIMVVWFLSMAWLGINGISLNPSVLSAINPWYAVVFFFSHGPDSLMILGAVFLCLTGGEAMYADMGHFGRLPIKRGWFYIAFPCLLLNYFGQGALILTNPSSVSNPFFNLAPQWAVIPLVCLATMATVIASQALISGVFSLTRQAIQLGYAPRMEIRHTNNEAIGQVYVPIVNWSLLIGALALVFTFKSSGAIAHAYGIAVSLTMFITTLLAFVVARYIWRWSVLKVLVVCVPLIVIDMAFFIANAVKFFEGGWIPILLACLIFLLSSTWIRGRELLIASLKAQSIPLDTFCSMVDDNPPIKVPGVAIYMTGVSSGTPLQLVSLLKTTKVLHQRVIFLTYQTLEIPFVEAREGTKIENIAYGIWRVVVTVGYMETPNVIKTIALCKDLGLPIKLEDITFFLGRSIVLPTEKAGMAIWRERLFAFMTRNAIEPSMFFNIPPASVVEVGLQVEL